MKPLDPSDVPLLRDVQTHTSDEPGFWEMLERCEALTRDGRLRRVDEPDGPLFLITELGELALRVAVRRPGIVP